MNCTESQIKNWYSNKRKKQKLLARRRGYSCVNYLILRNSNKVDAEPDVPISIPKINQNNTSINAEHPISQIPINPLLKPIAIPISQPSQPNGLTEAEFKLQTQNILKPIIQQQLPQNANFVPAYQNMPVFIIPAAPMNNSSMTINTNTINTNTIYENQIKKTNNNFEKGHGHEERVLHPKGTNGIQTQSQNQFQAHNQFEPRHTTQTNWVSQTQTFPIQNNPVIIVSNKPMNYGNQGYMIAQNGIPMQQAQPMGGMMPFEQPPMQIQYLTSLYAPYSNNNIFSNYYPVVYQTAPNVQFQPVQQVNGELQGQMMQQQPSFQQMDLKTIPMIKPNALRRFGVPQENINDINNVNKDN